MYMKMFSFKELQGQMQKLQIVYTLPLDALIAVTKRLSLSESQQGLTSEEFLDRYNKGQLPDDECCIEWANDYRHLLGLRQELEKRSQNDSTPHFPDLPTFPHHKHLRDEVIAREKLNLIKVLQGAANA